MSAIGRRDVLGWSAVVAGVVATTWGVSRLPSGAPSGRAPGYGIDPPLTEPKRFVWARVLDADARRDIAVLIDIVVPGIDGSPPGSVVGLVDFFDEWLGAPYPEMEADRALILPLVKSVKAIADGNPAQREDAVKAASHGPHAAAFARFRTLAAAAYYTTPKGIAALGYVGNEPLASFDGPPAIVLAHFDAELAKLDFER